MLAGCGGSQQAIVPATTNAAAPSFRYDKTFSYTGEKEAFQVPRGVKWLRIIALGAGGASKANDAGGRGGRVYAIVPVISGETLLVYVGGAGSGATGGFNGGGGGGYVGGYQPGYGGGGASDVRRNGDRLADRILVAGGGGGQGGYDDFRRIAFGDGGKGGGSTGGTGSADTAASARAPTPAPMGATPEREERKGTAAPVASAELMRTVSAILAAAEGAALAAPAARVPRADRRLDGPEAAGGRLVLRRTHLAQIRDVARLENGDR
jgi:hypothetical protein